MTYPITLEMPLGKHPAKHDHRRLHLASYFQTAMPEPQTSRDWSTQVTNLGPMGNNRRGCCTLSAAGHMEQTWTANSGTQVILPDDVIEQAYIDVTGEEGAAYNPVTGANDNGCALPDVLEYWRLKGIGGRKILAWADIEVGNTKLVKQGADYFGGLYIGLALPLSAFDQINAGQPWTLAQRFGLRAQPYSWGGHCVELAAYDPDWVTFLTWGRKQKASWAWFLEYCDEAAAVISQMSWIGKGNVSPSGLAIDALTADLANMGTVHTELMAQALHHGIAPAQILALWKQYGPAAVSIITEILNLIASQPAKAQSRMRSTPMMGSCDASHEFGQEPRGMTPDERRRLSAHLARR